MWPLLELPLKQHNFQSLEEGLIFIDFLPWFPEETLTSHLTLLSGK